MSDFNRNMTFIALPARGPFGPPKDPTGVWLCLKASTVGAAAIAAADGTAALYDLLVAPDPAGVDVSTTIWLAAESVTSYGGWVVYLATLMFSIWLTYRLMRNLHTLAPGRSLMSPTYAMSSYLMPFVGLFMVPYVAGMLWRSTFAVADESKAKTDPVGWWWGLTLLAWLLYASAAVAERNSGAYDEAAIFDESLYEQSLVMSASASLLLVVASLLLLRVFGPIARAQSQLIRARAI